MEEWTYDEVPIQSTKRLQQQTIHPLSQQREKRGGKNTLEKKKRTTRSCGWEEKSGSVQIKQNQFYKIRFIGAAQIRGHKFWRTPDRPPFYIEGRILPVP